MRIRFNLSILLNVRYAFVHRLSQVILNGVTLLIIPFYFDKIEVGIYYLLINLIALQVLFELGLGQALIQINSHISAASRVSKQYKYFLSQIDGRFLIISLKFFVVSSILGCIYFYLFLPNNYDSVYYIFVLMAGSSAMHLRYSYNYSLLESRGFVNVSNKIKFYLLLISSSCFWVCVYLDFGLFSMAVYMLFSAFYVDRVFRGRGKLFINDELLIDKEIFNTYTKELFLLQKKFKISYISGYLASSFIVPITFAILSPVEAGQFGLSLSIFSVVTVISSLIVVVNNHKMAKFISQNKFIELNILFKYLITLVVILGLLLGGGIFVLLLILFNFYPNLYDKFLASDLLFLMYVASLLNSIIYSMALYIRSHKVELLVGTSIIGALLVVGLVFVGSLFGIAYVVYGYVASIVFFGFPVTFWIFWVKFRMNQRKAIN